jgi:hypothetical protein
VTKTEERIEELRAVVLANDATSRERMAGFEAWQRIVNIALGVVLTLAVTTCYQAAGRGSPALAGTPASAASGGPK